MQNDQEANRAADNDVVEDVAVATAHADEHFAGHVVKSAHDVQASEDILAANGMKLLAKGARVDAATHEKLVAHKLAKPLEQCLEMSDAVDGEALVAVARKLFEEQPALRVLHGDRQPQALAALARLPLTAQLRSLLSLYAELPWASLDHPVAVALLALGLAGKVCPDQTGWERSLLTAGLFHDVGELYVDPGLFTGTKLEPAQWRQIVAHPVIGHRVLARINGAGPMVADAVLQHHERHDGFGYPRRLAGARLPIRGELLAAAEWLAGLTRSGRSTDTAASAAARLVPGNFRDTIAQALWSATKRDSSEDCAASDSTHDVVAQLVRISQTIDRFRDAQPWIVGLISAGGGASAVLAANYQRMETIERSFVSSGLSGAEPLVIFDRMNAFNDPSMLQELGAIAREIGWRLRELERDTLLRASSLDEEQQHTVQQMISRLKTPDPD